MKTILLICGIFVFSVSAIASYSSGSIKLPGGKKRNLNPAFEGKMQCVVNGLSDKLNYRIIPDNQTGCMRYDRRPVPGRSSTSLHYIGMACDINQWGRGITRADMRRHGNQIRALAEECGVVDGAVFRPQDIGHFEARSFQRGASVNRASGPQGYQRKPNHRKKSLRDNRSDRYKQADGGRNFYDLVPQN